MLGICFITLPHEGQYFRFSSTSAPQLAHIIILNLPNFTYQLSFCPHSPQNRIPCLCSAPQPGQISFCGVESLVPHSWQNFIPAAHTLPQLGHTVPLAAGSGALMRLPHAMQKFVPSGFTVPQCPHVLAASFASSSALRASSAALRSSSSRFAFSTDTVIRSVSLSISPMRCASSGNCSAPNFSYAASPSSLSASSRLTDSASSAVYANAAYSSKSKSSALCASSAEQPFKLSSAMHTPPFLDSSCRSLQTCTH